MDRQNKTEETRVGATRPIRPRVHTPGWIQYSSDDTPVAGWPAGRDVFVSEIIGDESIRLLSTTGELVTMLRRNVDLGEEIFLDGEWYPEHSPTALAHFAKRQDFVD